MFTDLLRLAWGNMRQARLRLLMTSAGVVVGTCAVILLVALTLGLQQIAESSIGGNAILTEITVYPSTQSAFGDDRPLLNAEAVTTFNNLAGVQSAIPLYELGGRSEFRVGTLSNFATIYGIPPEGLSAMNISLASGELTINSGEGVLGVNVPRYFFDEEAVDFEAVELDVYENLLELVLLNFEGDEQIIDIQTNGILQEGTSRFDNAVFLPLDDVLEYEAWITDTSTIDELLEYNQVLIRTSNRDVTNPIRTQLETMGYETDGIGDFLDELNSFFGTLRLILGVTGSIALLVAAVVVTNTMTMTVLERTSEIGVMKAIGARNRDVLLVFLFEAGLVGFLGGIAGVLLSLLLGNLINDVISRSQFEGTSSIGFLPINTAMIDNELIFIPQELILIAISIATVVGIVAGFFPAWRAANMSPVNALRS